MNIGAFSSEQIDQEHAMALLKANAFNNQGFSEFVHNYCTNTLNARDSCAAALQQQPPLMMIIHQFLRTNFDFLKTLESQQREKLQWYYNGFVEKLSCIVFWKKMSAVFFTAAAAISAAEAAAAKTPAAAAAASAASILLGALRIWTHSLMQKEESAVKKHKGVTSAMIMGAEAITKDLDEINELQVVIESLLVVDDGGDMEALNTSFHELERKVDDYCRHISCARRIVLKSIIKNTSIDAIQYYYGN